MNYKCELSAYYLSVFWICYFYLAIYTVVCKKTAHEWHKKIINYQLK